MPYPPCVVLMALSVAAYLFTSINPIVLVIVGVFAGLALGSCYEKRGLNHDIA